MLANVLRPFSLDAIVGQTAVVKTLKNFLLANSLPSVIYLIGASGTGKSTIADILAATLNCESPTIVDGIPTPCGKCGSCQDIKKGIYQQGVTVYNGGAMSSEDIRKLEEDLAYSTFSKNRVVILNEAQQIRELRRLMEVIEEERPNTYFIFTSTDRSKFSNLAASKDNKDQEKQALRSRGCFLNFKPIPESTIATYIFNIVDSMPNSKDIPDSFVYECIPLIAQNADGNIRLAINDVNTALAGESYTPEAVVDLLGYTNKKDYMEYIYQIMDGDSKVIERLLNLEDLYNFYMYTSSVIFNAFLYKNKFISPVEQYQLESYAALTKDSGRFIQVYEFFTEMEKVNLTCSSFKQFENFFMMSLVRRLFILRIKTTPSGIGHKIKVEV